MSRFAPVKPRCSSPALQPEERGDLPSAPRLQQRQQNLRPVHYAVLGLLAVKHVPQELLHTFLPVDQHTHVSTATTATIRWLLSSQNTHFWAFWGKKRLRFVFEKE